MSDLDESCEIRRKMGDFTYRVNTLRANFRDVSSHVLMRLFGTVVTARVTMGNKLFIYNTTLPNNG